jgi:hypothetical protein
MLISGKKIVISVIGTHAEAMIATKEGPVCLRPGGAS